MEDVHLHNLLQKDLVVEMVINYLLFRQLIHLKSIIMLMEYSKNNLSFFHNQEHYQLKIQILRSPIQ